MPVSLAKTMLPRTPNQRRFKMNKLYVYAGIAASVIMIAIGIGSRSRGSRVPRT
jgi:ribosomal protein L13